MSLKEFMDLITNQPVSKDVEAFMVVASAESGECYQVCNVESEELFRMLLTAYQDSDTVKEAVKALVNYVTKNESRAINLDSKPKKIVS